MTPSDLDVSTPRLADRIAPIGPRVAAAFEAVAAVTHVVRRSPHARMAALRGPVGRLLQVGQVRDVFDQRAAHLENAFAASAAMAPLVRAAVTRIAAGQVAELARLLADCAGTASVAFGAIEDQIGVLPQAEGGDALEDIEDALADGIEAAETMNDLAARLRSEADATEPECAAASGAAILDVDLGWMAALYTMEEERRVHLAVLDAARG